MQRATLSSPNASQPIAYKDLFLRLIACIVATHFLIVYGETKSTFEILLTADYYYAFIGSFIIALLLFTVVRSITIKLDQNFDWKEQPVYRTGLQLFCGLMLPGFLAFLLATFYFRVRGVNILQTSYLRYDFQFILVQLLLINLYYAAYYFYARWLQAEKLLHGITGHLSQDAAKALKSTFSVSKGAKNIRLEMDEIAYCYREGERVFLRTFSGEDFFISQSLDDVQQQTPEANFFRLNRQMLAHRRACKGFSLLSYGKLEAQLTPPYKSEVVISQKRSVAFKKWLEPQALQQQVSVQSEYH